MKILIIDNKSYYLDNIIKAILPYGYEVIPYDQITSSKMDNFNKIILSGGHKYPVKYHSGKYKKEIKLIKNSTKPILGICLGFELIGYSFGENLIRLKHRNRGKRLVTKIKKDNLLKKLTNFYVFESHRWAIENTNFLIPLAISKSGVEVLRHPTKKIFGVQFHPEIVMNKSRAQKIIQNFLK